jgi:hypothetical protein
VKHKKGDFMKKSINKIVFVALAALLVLALAASCSNPAGGLGSSAVIDDTVPGGGTEPGVGGGGETGEPGAGGGGETGEPGAGGGGETGEPGITGHLQISSVKPGEEGCYGVGENFLFMVTVAYDDGTWGSSELVERHNPLTETGELGFHFEMFGLEGDCLVKVRSLADRLRLAQSKDTLTLYADEDITKPFDLANPIYLRSDGEVTIRFTSSDAEGIKENLKPIGGVIFGNYRY